MSASASGAPVPPPTHVRFGTGPGRGVLLATILASGMAFLDSSVVNVALPAIGGELDAEVAGLQWTVTGYLVSLSALILLGGAFGDRYGRRRIFMYGVMWFTLASLACAFAVSVPMLVGARVLQGAGSALMTPGSLAIIESTFVPDERPKAIGAWSGLSGLAAALGPFLGGWLVDVASWRLVFLINLPLAAVVLFAARRWIPESRDPTVSGRLDLTGALLAVVGLGSLTYGLIAAGDRGMGSPVVLATVLTGSAALVAFVVVQWRKTSPMLPLDIFRSRQFSGANLVTVTVYASIGTSFFLIVVFLQQALGYSALQAGAAVMPITFLLLVLSARSGDLAQRIGPRLQMSAGPLVIAGGLVLVSTISPGDTYAAGVLPGVLVYGIGLAAMVAPLTATVLGAVDDTRAGLASGVNNAVARVAELTGVAIIPVVAGITGDAYRDPALFTPGFRTALLITAGLATAGGVLGWFTIRNPVQVKGAARRERPAAHTPSHGCLDTPPLVGLPSRSRAESAADLR